MRGSLQGFTEINLKSYFGGWGNTITLVEDSEGQVFGGYTDLIFDGNSNYIDGKKNSFLFAFQGWSIIKCKCLNG